MKKLSFFYLISLLSFSMNAVADFGTTKIDAAGDVVVFPSSSTSIAGCATTYTAYLTMNAYTDYSYNDSTYQPSGSPVGPGMSFYLSRMPAAGVPVPPYGLPLCAGTYNVTVNLFIRTGSCGGNPARCNLNMRLYAGGANIGGPTWYDPGTIIKSDAGLGANLPQWTYLQISPISGIWQTSQGPLFPPVFRGNGSDSLLVVPGQNSNVTVQWTGQ